MNRSCFQIKQSRGGQRVTLESAFTYSNVTRSLAESLSGIGRLSCSTIKKMKQKNRQTNAWIRVGNNIFSKWPVAKERRSRSCEHEKAVRPVKSCTITTLSINRNLISTRSPLETVSSTSVVAMKISILKFDFDCQKQCCLSCPVVIQYHNEYSTLDISDHLLRQVVSIPVEIISLQVGAQNGVSIHFRFGLSTACFSEEAIVATDAEKVTTDKSEAACLTQIGRGEPAEGSGKPCLFPFHYDGVTAHGCLPGAGGNWCSTLNDRDGNHLSDHWGFCSEGCPVHEEASSSEATSCVTVDGEDVGRACQFPFIYEDTEYDGCIYWDMDYFWCSTENDENGVTLANKWGFCSNACPKHAHAQTQDSLLAPGEENGCVTDGGPHTGEPCLFPFSYQGLRSNGCIQSGEAAWCSTLNDAAGEHIEPNWGFCSADCPVDPDPQAVDTGSTTSDDTCHTVEETIENQICHFPFVYNGKKYNGCTDIGEEEGNYWCYYQVDEFNNGVSGLWGYCSPSCPVANLGVSDQCVTIDGPVPDAPCKIPWSLVENGAVQHFKGCATLEKERPWCPTTLDSGGNSVDGEWGYCSSDCPLVEFKDAEKLSACVTVDGNDVGVPCVFPFVASEEVNYGCRSESTGGRTWCSTKVDEGNNYVHPHSGTCSEGCPRHEQYVELDGK